MNEKLIADHRLLITFPEKLNMSFNAATLDENNQ
jgi:hypothetical protein